MADCVYASRESGVESLRRSSKALERLCDHRRLEKLGVAPLRGGGLGVAEKLGDDLQANASIDQVGSKRPAQRVRTDPRYVPPILIRGVRSRTPARPETRLTTVQTCACRIARPERVARNGESGSVEAELCLMDEPTRAIGATSGRRMGIVRRPVGVLDCRTTISICARSTSRFSRLSASPPRIPVQSSNGTTMRSAGVVQAASNASDSEVVNRSLRPWKIRGRSIWAIGFDGTCSNRARNAKNAFSATRLFRTVRRLGDRP